MSQAEAGLRIQTGARLHCGLFSDPRPGGFRFQGVGFMIESPGLDLTLRPVSGESHIVLDRQAEETITEPESEALKRRILRTIELCEQTWGDSSPAMQLEVGAMIPPHTGFGSGTQLDLAVGCLWTRCQEIRVPVIELARVLHRGRRSTIGTHGFSQGGLLIDRGVEREDQMGRCRFQTNLPESWRILLVTPRTLSGYSGEEEREAFRHLEELSPAVLAELHRDLETIERAPHDFEVLSETIQRYGNRVGDSFASLQGGRYRDPICEQIVARLNRFGLKGVAQTSWGPTIFALCRDQEQAEEAAKALDQFSRHNDVRITRPRNQGANFVGSQADSRLMPGAF